MRTPSHYLAEVSMLSSAAASYKHTMFVTTIGAVVALLLLVLDGALAHPYRFAGIGIVLALPIYHAVSGYYGTRKAFRVLWSRMGPASQSFVRVHLTALGCEK